MTAPGFASVAVSAASIPCTLFYTTGSIAVSICLPVHKQESRESAKLSRDCFISKCISGPLAKRAPEPPHATLDGYQQVYPAPRFLNHPVTGGHGKEKEAGNGGNLLQPPVAQLPLKAAATSGPVSPHNQSRCCQQDARTGQAKRAEIGRNSVYIECCAAHAIGLSATRGCATTCGYAYYIIDYNTMRPDVVY